MTSTVPAVIAWPVIAVMVFLLAARIRWCRTNLYDAYFTNLMAFIMVAQVLRERDVEAVLSKLGLMRVTTAQQFGFAAMIFASTEMIGFTMLWTHLSPQATRRRHRYYRAAAVVLCAAFLLAAHRARAAGQTLELSGGWDAIWAWAFYLTMVLVLAARVTWMFRCELGKTTRRREMLLAVGGLVLGVVTGVVSLEALVLAVTDQLGWTKTVGFRLWFHGYEFFYEAFLVFLLGAVPLVVKLGMHLGLDPTSRTWNRLQPLRQSMTTIVPECDLDLGHNNDRRPQKTTLQLHQSIITIRDAALRLRPFSRDVPPQELARFLTEHAVPAREHDAAARALELARAARAKTAGAAPRAAEPATRSTSTTLDQEAAELLMLAKWWKPARVWCGQAAAGAFDGKTRLPA